MPPKGALALFSGDQLVGHTKADLNALKIPGTAAMQRNDQRCLGPDGEIDLHLVGHRDLTFWMRISRHARKTRHCIQHRILVREQFVFLTCTPRQERL